jgi:hypothetical protein
MSNRWSEMSEFQLGSASRGSAKTDGGSRLARMARSEVGGFYERSSVFNAIGAFFCNSLILLCHKRRKCGGFCMKDWQHGHR